MPLLSSDEEEEFFVKEWLFDATESFHQHKPMKRAASPLSSEDSVGDRPSKASKSDYRHSFPKLFEDGMNSSDPDFLQEALVTLMSSDCDMEAFRLDNYSNSGTERLEASLHSRANIINHFTGMVTSVPDSIFLIHEWKIFSRPNQHSCLVFKFSMTGTQMYEFESPCAAQDHANGFQRSSWVRRSDPGRAQPTVQFREGGRTGKYDARRRHKVRTIGEYVDCNQMNSDYSPSTEHEEYECSMGQQPEQSWVGAVHDALPVTHDSSCAMSSHGSSPLTIDNDDSVCEGGAGAGAEATNLRKTKAKKINICGVMRFHMDPDHKVWKVHCVHIHDM